MASIENKIKAIKAPKNLLDLERKQGMQEYLSKLSRISKLFCCNQLLSIKIQQ